MRRPPRRTSSGPRPAPSSRGAQWRRSRTPEAPATVSSSMPRRPTRERRGRFVSPSRIPTRIRPMLATPTAGVFAPAGWIYEEKYDGIRLMAYKDGAKVILLTRNMIDRTDRFSEIAAAVAALPAPTIVLDGEAVV